MNENEFFALQYRELNLIREICEKNDAVQAYKITERGLMPVEENSDNVDVVFGRNAIYFYIPARSSSGNRRVPNECLMPDLFRLLAQIPGLDSLSNEHLDQLAKAARRRVFPAGTLIVRQGDAGDSLFVVSQGSARVYDGSENEDQSYGSLGPGSCFGEMALLTGAPRSASVVAEIDMVAYEITKDSLKPFLENNEGLLIALSNLMTDRHLTAEYKKHFEAFMSSHEAKLKQSFSNKLKHFFGLD
jgi:CRP-like cAMP-binding protein